MTGSLKYSQEYLDRGTDRVGLHIYPEPEHVTEAPVIVLWPAMGVPAGYYTRFAAALRRAGFAVVVADLRGTGTSTPRPSRTSRYGYADLVSDVGAVQEALKPRIDGRRRLLLGHSLGGQVALLHSALAEDPMTDGLVLVATGVPHWRSYRGLFGPGILTFAAGISGASALLGVWPGWGFGGRQARPVIRDWARIVRTGRFPVINGLDPEEVLRSLAIPILAVSIEGDRHTPRHTLDLMCAKLAAAPVEREHYGAAQSGRPMDHFSWTRAGEALAERIAAFAAALPC